MTLYCKIITNTCFICLFSNCVCTLKRIIGSGETLERETALFLEKNTVLGKPKQPVGGGTGKKAQDHYKAQES